MLEFTRDAIWYWTFCWDIFDYWFYPLTHDWSVQIFSFSWFSLGKLCVSWNLYISSRLPNLLTYNCSQQSLMILCISVASVVMSPLSLLILSLLSPAKGLAILFISTKNQLLVLLIYSTAFLVSISLFLLWSLLFPSFY